MRIIGRLQALWILNKRVLLNMLPDGKIQMILFSFLYSIMEMYDLYIKKSYVTHKRWKPPFLGSLISHPTFEYLRLTAWNPQKGPSRALQTVRSIIIGGLHICFSSSKKGPGGGLIMSSATQCVMRVQPYCMHVISIREDRRTAVQEEGKKNCRHTCFWNFLY